MLEFFLTFFVQPFRKIIKQSVVAIIPPASYGSVGDDAMVRVLLNNIDKQGLSPIILGGKEAKTWSIIGTVKVRVIDKTKPLVTLFNVVVLLLKSKRLYIIGADIMDGHYDSNSVYKRLKLANVFSMLGGEVICTGFSFNDTPDKEVCKKLDELSNVRLYLRDLISYERFKRHVNYVPELSADLAFLTVASVHTKNSEAIAVWVSRRKSQNDVVIIVNINWLPFRHSEIEVDRLIERYTAICLGLHRKLNGKVSFLMVPNDFRDPGGLGDKRLARLLYDALVRDLKDKCMLVGSDFTAEELKLFTAGCDFVISGRMHLAIITATNSIPSFSVSYQQKFAGFYKHIGLNEADLMIEPDELFNYNIVGKILVNVVNRKKLQQKISDNLPLVENMARKNL